MVIYRIDTPNQSIQIVVTTRTTTITNPANLEYYLCVDWVVSGIADISDRISTQLVLISPKISKISICLLSWVIRTWYNHPKSSLSFLYSRLLLLVLLLSLFMAWTTVAIDPILALVAKSKSKWHSSSPSSSPLSLTAAYLSPLKLRKPS